MRDHDHRAPFSQARKRPVGADRLGRSVRHQDLVRDEAHERRSGLACGRPIRGTVAFLGGPLQYLSELDKLFCETLDLDDEHALRPKNGVVLVRSSVKGA